MYHCTNTFKVNVIYSECSGMGTWNILGYSSKLCMLVNDVITNYIQNCQRECESVSILCSVDYVTEFVHVLDTTFMDQYNICYLFLHNKKFVN